MTKIKFKFHQRPLSDEQIGSFKNFDSLMTAFVASPKPSLQYRLIHNRIFIYTSGIMSGIIIATIVAFLTFNQSDSNKNLTGVQTVTDASTTTEQTVSVSTNSTRQNTVTGNSVAELKNETTETLNSVSPSINSVEQKQNSVSVTEGKPKEKNTSVPKSVSTNSIVEKKNDNPVPLIKDNSEEKYYSENKSIDEDVVNENSSANKSSTQKDNIEEKKNNSQSTVTAEVNNETDAENQEAIVSAPVENKHDPEENISSDNQTVTVTPSEQNEIQNDDTSHRFKETVTQFTNVVDTVAAQTIQQSKESYVWITTKLNGMMSKGFTRKSRISSNEKNDKSDSTVDRPAQVSFFFPIGSNGINSGRYSNYFSLNMLWGFNGGVKGMEIGGLVNVDRKTVTGAQIGGLTNLTFGNLKGAQVAGLVNQAKNVEGVQIGGLVNSSLGKMIGLQVGGLINYALDTLYGTQIGGLFNLSTTRKPSVGLQLGGLGNLSTGKLSGTQIGGLLNVANKLNGTQISGLINVAGKVNGSQISFINIGWKVKGFQLGFINISDSLKGVPIGFLSISRNGLFKVDVFNTDFSSANIALRCGSNSFYNIFAIGVTPNTSHGNRYSFGYGIGTHFKFSEKFFMNLDGISWSVHYNNLREWNGINMVNQLRLLPGFQIAKGFGFYAGPVLNVEVIDDSYNSVSRYTLYSQHTGISTTVNGWIGWTVGLQFF